jgi:NAD(P)-dependent dehydrogenase (short-subunit alcohol dehydrogenase family)
MSGRFEGKAVIVTGAGGGIGREHARLFASEGASVLVNDTGRRTGADAAAVVAEIEAAGGHAVADTSSATWDGADAIVGHAIDAFGRLDVVVNNATAARNNDIWKLTEREWDLAIDVNLKGYFAMIRAAAPHLCGQGAGVVVNTSSGSGFGHPSAVAYAAAKEGVVGLTRTVARELGRFGVRCNAIRPLALGVSTREYSEHTSKWSEVMALTMAPRGTQSAFSVATPETHPPAKISPLVVWLCTDAARGVNGRTFHVAGDTISLLSEPARERAITQSGGWTLDALDRIAPTNLVDDLTDDYRLDEHPDLQVFELDG